MEILPFKYQATLFCNNSDIRPDAKLVQSLFNGLLQWEIFPNVTKELTVTMNGLNATKPEQIDRLQFISSDKFRRINFLGNRIDFELFIPTRDQVIRVEDFVETTKQQFSIISEILEKKYNRLSLVSLYYSPNKSTDFFDKIYSSVFNNPIHIGENKSTPTEWNTRSNYSGIFQVGPLQERMNYNITFGRKIQQNNGYLSNEDRLEVMFDLNTHQNNTAYRFSKKDVLSFFTDIVIKQKEITDLTLNAFQPV